jgi:hypothetical protein
VKLAHALIAVAVIAGAVLGSAGVALATFTGSATATMSVSSRSLSAPGSLAGSALGHAVSLVWSAGSGGTTYAVTAVNNGSSSSCAGVTYTALGTTPSLTWSDPRSTPQGTYECYQVSTSYAGWTSLGSPTVAVQIGVVASTVQITNGTGSSSRLDTGDRIVVTFNQAIAGSSEPSSSDSICTSTSGYVALGSTATGSSCSSSGLELGTLTGLSVNASSRYAASWSWNSSNTVLTITVGSRTAGSTTPTVTGTGTFTPTAATSALLSGSGGYHVCTSNTGGGNCLPTATGSF